MAERTGHSVGGPTIGEGNIISGNGGDGIDINGTGSLANLIEGNFVGTDASGNARLGNTLDGILGKEPPSK